MYDAIIVGARCAGSPTATLLAQKGYRVLLVDRATFPSDTLSTHYIHQPGVAKLQKWGLLSKVAATGCPSIEAQVFDVGPFALSGVPPPASGVGVGYAPRRTVLDKILVDAAVEAGAEFRERFVVREILTDDGGVIGIRGRSEGGSTTTERARIVIGADGMRSTIARLVDAPVYESMPAYSCAFYTYWHDVAVHTAELYPRPNRMTIAVPTNDRLTLTIVYWPEGEFQRVRSDLERNFMEALAAVPPLFERVRACKRAEGIRGTAELGNFFRRPYGPGWALVGDAGYHKNPITAEGITDAFRDAEFLVDALDEAFTGRTPMEAALREYERKRNEAAMPIYRLTCDLAKLERPSDDMQKLFAALRGNPLQTGRFIGTIAGTVPIHEFFSPENVNRIMAAGAGA
jgi:flavin-dependent dehydrogenase